MKILKLILIGLTFCSVSCNQGPKIISTPVEANSSSNVKSTGIFSDTEISTPTSAVPAPSDVHTVKVLEVLPTSKYVYLRVNEEDEEFWIATGKKDVKVGETYYYKNGILKTNFESKEHNRVFDKVFLVSNIVSANHGGESSNASIQKKEIILIDLPNDIEVQGSIKISELVKNKKSYEGKEIQLSGKCTKLNPNIMGRNWIHLKDGSYDDFDLVITSDVSVPEGHFVTMKGVVVLDKDFGAGYKYDLIIENGQIVSSK
jgi:hypothetical protein